MWPNIRDSRELRRELHDFLCALTGGRHPIDDDDDIVARGLIKSMNVMDIVNHLESRYGVVVSQRDVFAGRLRSLAGLLGLVQAAGGSR